jgi:Tc toxin complex TcA C-terminal TcB-binding domain
MISKTTAAVGFHSYADATRNIALYTYSHDYQFTYELENFFHPYVGRLIQLLNDGSVQALLDPKEHQAMAVKAEDFFAAFYRSLADESKGLVELRPHDREIDVSNGGPYANYNWELLFHIPLTIAVHLSKNQRFQAAQKWFHYIFDPTSTDTSVPAPARYWKFLRFRRDTDVQQIDDLLRLLAKPDDECSDRERDTKLEILRGYSEVRDKPFQPHVVARSRTVAYQYNVVMKYLQNLIDWGDSLFVQDTIESINEATQHYVLAANILGPRPVRVPAAGNVSPRTFAQLKKSGLDDTGNAFVDLETEFPFNSSLPPNGNSTGNDGNDALLGIGRTLYFCVPRNEKLLSYWDVVADRLFKIRNCMNIEGVVRQLALFDPPIDPGMLVKAAAAGLDIGGLVSGLNQPTAPIRSSLLIQKALECAGELRGMGAALLSAIEKGDGEHLTQLRQTHETRLQELSREVKFLQWKQAEQASETLLRSRAIALERYKYYLRLLGQTVDSNLVPETITLDRRQLTEDNFDESFASLVEQYDKAIGMQAFPPLALAGNSAPSSQSGGGTGTLLLNTTEDQELNSLLPSARDNRLAASIAETVGTVLTLVPEVNIELAYWGIGGSSKLFGGSKLADAAKIASDILKTVAAYQGDQAGMASKAAAYQRRAEDWLLQSNLAARDLVSNGRQVLSALIAEQVSHHDYLNAKAQIDQTNEVARFLQDKFSNEELYGYLQGEISRLFYQYYRFAFDTARRAETTMKQELMRPELDGTDFVQFNYWDAGRKGLLSGEALYLDVKRLEMAYHDSNKREFEMVRHVSLRQLDPLALLHLKLTGECDFSIPEALFDRDSPGQYLRRIKAVGLSSPAVVGPYTSVHAKLSLTRSSVRRVATLQDGSYGRSQASEDDRFVDYYGSVQSIVTSTGTNDSGMFDTNLRDDRFLPFEGAGAISSWHVQLPVDFPAFDYTTISDLILHVRYTAREGGALLGRTATSELRQMLTEAGRADLALFFSLRHDFPTEFAAFLADQVATGPITLQLRKDYFPYMVQGFGLRVEAIELYAPAAAGITKRTFGTAAELTALSDGLNAGPEHVATLTVAPDAAVLRKAADSEPYLIIRYGLD